MRTKELKVSIKVTVPKTLIDASDEPYFYKIGFEKEGEVVENEVENGVEAWFDGFELLDVPSETLSATGIDSEPMVTARLHYTVFVEVN